MPKPPPQLALPLKLPALPLPLKLPALPLPLKLPVLPLPLKLPRLPLPLKLPALPLPLPLPLEASAMSAPASRPVTAISPRPMGRSAILTTVEASATMIAASSVQTAIPLPSNGLAVAWRVPRRTQADGLGSAINGLPGR
ncbi:MAG: hypothetical protein EOR71_06345 [Mesorhizobium sp.]|nr:MAG: hypothetical protein EOR71_06345 [Mesorhizobium sp.]